MRRLLMGASFAALAAMSGPGSAQSLEQGPLAAPAPAAIAAMRHKAKPRHRGSAKTEANMRGPRVDDERNGPARAALPPAGQGAANGYGDPVSFGMKWNGSNDTARETRIQNFDGTNSGTGAELGMKLHF